MSEWVSECVPVPVLCVHLFFLNGRVSTTLTALMALKAIQTILKTDRTVYHHFTEQWKYAGNDGNLLMAKQKCTSSQPYGWLSSATIYHVVFGSVVLRRLRHRLSIHGDHFEHYIHVSSRCLLNSFLQLPSRKIFSQVVRAESVRLCIWLNSSPFSIVGPGMWCCLCECECVWALFLFSHRWLLLLFMPIQYGNFACFLFRFHRFVRIEYAWVLPFSMVVGMRGKHPIRYTRTIGCDVL